MPRRSGTSIYDPIEMRFGERVIQFNPVRFEDENSSRRAGTIGKEPPVDGVTFFVGLNVGSRPVHSAEGVRAAVLRIRRGQLKAKLGEHGGAIMHGASVTPMLGYWETLTSVSGVEQGLEMSASVRILNMPYAYDDNGNGVSFSRDEFIGDMRELGMQLAVELEQEVIPMAVDHAGMVQETEMLWTTP